MKAPQGWAVDGREYVRDTGDDLVAFHYGHERAHNRSAIMDAAQAVFNNKYDGQNGALFHRYAEAWNEDIGTKAKRDALQTELFCDSFGAYVYAKVTGNTVWAQLGMTQNEAEAFTAAFNEAMADRAIAGADARAFSEHELHADIRAEDTYTYDRLVSLRDMRITPFPPVDSLRNEQGKLVRSEIIARANASMRQAGTAKVVNGQNTVLNKYTNVRLSAPTIAIRHGLDRRIEQNGQAAMAIGELLENALPINRYSEANRYVMLGFGKGEGKAYGAIFMVNQNSLAVEEFDTFDIVHSLNTRILDSAAFNGQQLHHEDALLTESNAISIADLLQNVYTNFSDILPKDVLEHFGASRRESKYSKDLAFSTHDFTPGTDNTTTMADRAIAGADEVNEGQVAAKAVEPEQMAFSEHDINVQPATREDGKNLAAIDSRNLLRYRSEVSSVLDNSFPTWQNILIGRPSAVLTSAMRSDKPLYMGAAAARKAALPNTAKGGKHGLGRIVLDELPVQLDNPLAITGNTTEHEALGDNSVVVWTDWVTEDGNPIIVPIRIDIDGGVEIYNNVNTIFDAYNSDYVANLLREGNLIYTRDGKSINELLSQRRQVPKSRSVDAQSSNTISNTEGKINPDTENLQLDMSTHDFTPGTGNTTTMAERAIAGAAAALRQKQLLQSVGDVSTEPVQVVFSNHELKTVATDAQTIDLNYRAVAAMAPVVQLTGREFDKNGRSLLDNVEDFFAQQGNRVDNRDLGAIYFARRDAKSSVSHGIG